MLPGNEADLSEFKKLQKRLNHESIKHQFRTKAFGGLHEEDVTKYIESLEETFKKLEQENKKSLDEIYTLRTRLNSELQEKDSLLNDLDETKQYLNSYIEKYNQKESDMNLLIENNDSCNVLMKNEIQQLKEEKAELENLLNESRMEFNEIKEYVLNFDDENTILKAQLSDLTLENAQIEELRNEILKLKEEKRNLNEAVTASNIEIEQIKQCSTKLENDNILMQSKLKELSEENKQIAELKNEKDKMSEELKLFEELLNQSSLEFEQIKNNAEKLEIENTHIKDVLTELQKDISSKDIKLNEVNRICMDLKHQLDIEKSSNEKLNMDVAIFKQKITNLQDTINENLQELDEQKKINEKTELELNKERTTNLSYKINGFKEEFSEMYKKIDNLEYEANQYLKSSSILQKQLAKEQNRADKAENELATFMNMLSGVKDKFISGQNPYENEVAELAERQVHKKQDSIISLDTLKKSNIN